MVRHFGGPGQDPRATAAVSYTKTGLAPESNKAAAAHGFFRWELSKIKHTETLSRLSGKPCLFVRFWKPVFLAQLPEATSTKLDSLMKCMSLLDTRARAPASAFFFSCQSYQSIFPPFFVLDALVKGAAALFSAILHLYPRMGSHMAVGNHHHTGLSHHPPLALTWTKKSVWQLLSAFSSPSCCICHERFSRCLAPPPPPPQLPPPIVLFGWKPI